MLSTLDYAQLAPLIEAELRFRSIKNDIHKERRDEKLAGQAPDEGEHASIPINTRQNPKHDAARTMALDSSPPGDSRGDVTSPALKIEPEQLDSVELLVPKKLGRRGLPSRTNLDKSDFDLLGTLFPTGLPLAPSESGQASSLSVNPESKVQLSPSALGFARMLDRSCTESACRILANPASRSTDFERIFRLSLQSYDRLSLLRDLKLALDRRAYDASDSAIHIGGAGTHYPRVSASSGSARRATTRHIGKVHPQMLSRIKSNIATMEADSCTVEVIGFEYVSSFASPCHRNQT